MSYRLEGWVNPYPRGSMAQPENIPELVLYDLYEAGADAMLEALRKDGKYFGRGSVVNEDAYPDKKWVNVSGYLVFIPEDTE